jgi:Protein of unknown function (DUF2695)
MDDTTATDLERELAETSLEMTEPDPDECVLCYVARMLDAFGCDQSLRWVRHWRQRRRPRATGLERHMRARGGFCDCEIFENGWGLREELLVPCEHGDLRDPDAWPPCQGVGPTSSQPCGNWRPWRRRGW